MKFNEKADPQEYCYNICNTNILSHWSTHLSLSLFLSQVGKIEGIATDAS